MMTETLRIQEKFVSLQGEGLLTGTPSSFVRVSGCNLRCTWCDTPLTSWTPTGTQESIANLIDFCKSGPRHVVITGGEPLLFQGVSTLAQHLLNAGHHVTIETAGTTWLEGISANLMSISPKLSHSTPHGNLSVSERHERRRLNMEVLSRLIELGPWQLKFVVQTMNSVELLRSLEEIETIVSKLDVSSEDRSRVLLMPEGVTWERILAGYRSLVPVCKKSGFSLGQRLHIALFGHQPGT